jgi:hypothetical protein
MNAKYFAAIKIWQIATFSLGCFSPPLGMSTFLNKEFRIKQLGIRGNRRCPQRRLFFRRNIRR